MKIIFLDIDGVLNQHQRFENGFTGIHLECVQRLNTLLEAIPEAQLVITSAWRYLMLGSQMTTNGFEYMLITHGVNCRGRVHGYTARDSFDREPTDKASWENSGLLCRAQQIKDYACSNFLNSNYVVIDDLPLDLPKNVFVKTDGQVGLTDTHVKKAIAILQANNT